MKSLELPLEQRMALLKGSTHIVFTIFKEGYVGYEIGLLKGSEPLMGKHSTQVRLELQRMLEKALPIRLTYEIRWSCSSAYGI